MRLMQFAACAAVVSLGVGVFAAPANADEIAKPSTCVHMAGQVRTALENNQQAANHRAAEKEWMYGREFCANGFDVKGMSHYNRALQLLNDPQKS